MIMPPGSLKGRFALGSCLRSAASVSGPEAKDSTVAEEMNPAICCHEGKGRNSSRPTKKATIILITAVPLRFSLARPRGALPLRAMAWEIRAVVVT